MMLFEQFGCLAKGVQGGEMHQMLQGSRGSDFPVAGLIAHRGGKKPVPHWGQVA
jgi:hypothetical protein